MSEVTVINAEVQLMKCIVDGMMVDVSANQFGGLASLGFLEETNTFIGRDDLFVRSIILVKAWGFTRDASWGAPRAHCDLCVGDARSVHHQQIPRRIDVSVVCFT